MCTAPEVTQKMHQGQRMPSMSNWSQEKKPMCLIWSKSIHRGLPLHLYQSIRSIFWVCPRALVLAFFTPRLQKGSFGKAEFDHSESDPIIVKFSSFMIKHHP